MAAFSATVVMPVTTSHLAGQAMRRPSGGSSARLTLLEHDRYAMAWEQLLANPQSLVFISSEDRHHSDALGQVSYHIKQQGHFQEKPTNLRAPRKSETLIVPVHEIHVLVYSGYRAVIATGDFSWCP